MKLKNILIAILIPLAVGTLSSLLSFGTTEDYSTFVKPTGSPPGFVFPIVWTILYVLMGLSSYLIYKSASNCKEEALTSYGANLILNFFWSIIFFGFKLYLFSFIWLIILWGSIILIMIQFYRIDKRAFYLLIPYLLWVTYAAYINIGVYILN